MLNDHRILRFERFILEQSVYPPGLYMSPHKDELSRISIILDGELQELTDSDAFKATPGSLVIKPNHVEHENIFGNSPVKTISISFYDDLLLTGKFNKWQWINHPKVNILGIRLWTGMQRAKTEKEAMNCVDGFFTALAVLKYDATGKTIFWQEQLRALLEKGLSEPERIETLAKKISLHRVYLARAFKNKYGVSPVEFRKYTKMAAALLDLSRTQKSLAAIAFDAGFSDQSHMTRELKMHTGCSPLEFRKMMNGI